MINSRAIVAVAVSGFLLAGCATSEPAPIADPPSASATPPAVATQPTLGDLVLSADGLGPLVIGEAPPVTDPALDVLIFDEDYCADVDGAPSPGKWIPNYEPALSDFSSEPFSVYVPEDVLEQIAIDSGDIVTAEGIGLGSTRDEILAAYPDAVLTENMNTDLYVLTGDNGRLVFEVGAEGQTEYAVGEVVFLRVLNLTDELFGWANTDAGFAYCVSA
jgi:hypothetical protein